MQFTNETRPSLILQEIRRLNAGMNGDGVEQIVKRAWMQKLPGRTREILSINEGQSIETLSKLADKLHDINVGQNINTANTVSVIQQNSSSLLADMVTNLFTALTTLTNGVSAMKIEMEQNHNRNSRPSYSPRGRSRSRSRNYRQ